MANLTVSEKHQFAIARKTLRMSDAGALVMGGMTKEEARAVIQKLAGKRVSRWAITEPGDEFGYFPYNKEPGDEFERE